MGQSTARVDPPGHPRRTPDGRTGSAREPYFSYKRSIYPEPGIDPLLLRLKDHFLRRSEWSTVSVAESSATLSSDPRMPPRLFISTWRSGPDVQGLDLRIKNASDLQACLGEVTNQLSSLETFRWACPVAPMPAVVHESLCKVQLKALHLDMSSWRGDLHTREAIENAYRLSED